MPTLAFGGLHDHWLWGVGRSLDKDGHVVFALCEHDVVCVRGVSDLLQLQAGFFFGLPLRAAVDGFAELQMAAGQRPSACAMGADTLTQKNKPVFDDDDADANTGNRVRLMFTHASNIACRAVMRPSVKLSGRPLLACHSRMLG